MKKVIRITVDIPKEYAKKNATWILNELFDYHSKTVQLGDAEFENDEKQ